MFRAALYTIAKTQKQPKCPPTDEWIKTTWCVCVCVCIHTHTKAIKRNEIMPFTATWLDLEIIILSEICQKEKDKYCMISHVKSKI